MSKALLLFVLLLFTANLNGVSALSLDEFLDQVRSQYLGYRGTKEQSQGEKLQARQGTLLISPNFFSSIELQSDKKMPPLSPVFYDKTIANNYSFGISELTPFGLSGKVSYQLEYLRFSGVTGAPPGTETRYYTAYPKIELSQPLWSGGFGRSVRANEALLKSQTLSAHYADSYQLRNILKNAEQSFYNLAFTREAIQIQTIALQNSKKILDWATNRFKRHLSDEADALQARAAYQLRQLDLESRKDEQSSQALAFNQFRGISSNEVSDEVDRPKLEAVLAMEAPTYASDSDDIRAARFQAQISQAAAQLTIEKVRPQLDVSLSAAFNGQDSSIANSFANSYSSSLSRPTLGAALTFNLPLHFIASTEVKNGAELQKLSAQILLSQKIADQKKAWADLVHRLEEAKKRLGLARTLEDTQQAKLVRERTRLQQGRTTTYQVLLFEQDYLETQLKRLELEHGILNLISEMKVFSSAPVR